MNSFIEQKASQDTKSKAGNIKTHISVISPDKVKDCNQNYPETKLDCVQENI